MKLAIFRFAAVAFTLATILLIAGWLSGIGVIVGIGKEPRVSFYSPRLLPKPEGGGILIEIFFGEFPRYWDLNAWSTRYIDWKSGTGPRYFFLIVATWIPAPVTAFLAFWFAKKYFQLERQLSLPQDIHCPKCNYDLRAHNPGDKCPECGTIIPPNPAEPPDL